MPRQPLELHSAHPARFLWESEKVIDIQRRGEIGVLRIEHGKANAFDVEFCEAVVERLDDLGQSAVRALVITGQGRIFSGK